jgi:hypothetical protein
MLISTGHTSEASGDASLHKLRVSCAAFRSLDAGSLLQIFKDNLKDMYDNTISLDIADSHLVPEDYFTALNDAMKAATNQPAVELDIKTHLYFFELS